MLSHLEVLSVANRVVDSDAFSASEKPRFIYLAAAIAAKNPYFLVSKAAKVLDFQNRIEHSKSLDIWLGRWCDITSPWIESGF